MPTEPRQPAWPLQFVTLPDGTVQFADVEQGSGADLQARAAVVLCTVKGSRDDEPGFGITPLNFQQGPVDTVRLSTELAQSDPALSVDTTEALNLLDATARQIGVNVGEGS